jgi:hypothetical protein
VLRLRVDFGRTSPLDTSRSEIFLRSEIILSGLQPNMSGEDVEQKPM